MAENIPKVLTSQDCLVTLMMAISASDGRILTAELVKIQSAVNHLPIFADYDVDRFTLMSQVVFNLFEKEDGLDMLFGLIRENLPDRLFETAYALCCDVGEDHARFGLLYLNDGVWNNKRIISKEWIDKSLNPSNTNSEYGFMWWLNTEWNNLPDNLYYGSGFGGNYIVVIPDENMVVVGRWLGRNTIGDFIEMILKSK